MPLLNTSASPAQSPYSVWQSVGYGLLLSLAYFSSAKLGLSLATVANNVTLVWPPTGLALFALLVFGVRLWPWVFVGAFITNYTTGLSVAPAAAIAAGNAMEALAGFYLLRIVHFDPALNRVRDVVYLVTLAAGLSTMVSASVGATALVLSHTIPWTNFTLVWLNWWMGDAMGNLVFASFLLAWSKKWHLHWHPVKIVEVSALVLGLIGVTHLALSGYLSPSGKPLPLAFVPFPLLIWAALRFEMRGATGATLIVGTVSLFNIIHGNSLFGSAGVFESMLLLWLYINVSAITGMALAASVSERRYAENQLRHLAQHDALTGLPSRAVLGDRIKQAILSADRLHCQVAVLFVDVDRFKVINDTLGHSAGDDFVIQVAERLSKSVRAKDTVTRQGGDEFVIVLDDVNQIEAATKAATTVLNAMRNCFVVHDTPLHMSASIGISLYPADGNNAETLLQHADVAMYRAKDMGRNNFVFYSPDMNVHATERLAMENRLRGALSRGEFTLDYQPQYDAKNGQILSAEALLRWRNAEGEQATPDIFIPLLEEIGLINEVGAWVIEQGCEQLARWHDCGWTHLRLAINISSHQVSNAELPQQVSTALNRWKLPPTCLELEITESLMVNNDTTTEDVLRRLVDLGVLLAVDDFGTGYSSLSYLHRLSIDTLKIDRAFVTNIPANEDSMAIARAIIGLGQSLRLNLVAEGVETIEQHAFLRELGCNLMQGYLFSRPLTAEAFSRLMEENASSRPVWPHDMPTPRQPGS